MKLFINSCAFAVQDEDHATAILRGNGESEDAGHGFAMTGATP